MLFKCDDNIVVCTNIAKNYSKYIKYMTEFVIFRLTLTFISGISNSVRRNQSGEFTSSRQLGTGTICGWRDLFTMAILCYVWQCMLECLWCEAYHRNTKTKYWWWGHLHKLLLQTGSSGKRRGIQDSKECGSLWSERPSLIRKAHFSWEKWALFSVLIDPFSPGNTLICGMHFEDIKQLVMHVVPRKHLFNIF